MAKLHKGQTFIEFQIPHGMTLHGTLLPGRFRLVFSTKKIDKLEEFYRAQLANVERVKEALKNAPPPVEEENGPGPQVSPKGKSGTIPTLVKKPKKDEEEDEDEETGESTPAEIDQGEDRHD